MGARPTSDVWKDGGQRSPGWGTPARGPRCLGVLRLGPRPPQECGIRGRPPGLPRPRSPARPSKPPPLPDTHRSGPRPPAPGPRSMAPGRPPARPWIPQRPGPAACAAAIYLRAEVSLAPATAPDVTYRAQGPTRRAPGGPGLG
nr:cleavage and polyadenylation specificity factor subunit 6-like isoform X2 [Manis javanica]